jgi:16S rRNA (uracil1498-N3)-methyltransferase
MSLPVHFSADLARSKPGDLIQLSGAEAHHAAIVRRLQVAECLELVDGKGTRATGVVAEVGKRSLVVAIQEIVSEPEPVPRITVVQAVPKGDHGERAVAMLTELGVAQIVPWSAERCVAVWRGERAAKGQTKWRATATEAAKQSRRSWWPEVMTLRTTAEVSDQLSQYDLVFVLHEEADQPLATLCRKAEAPSVCVVVGPEGGLTRAELQLFESAGGQVVRLGQEVLRTSTAGVAAVAALLSNTGRWAGHWTGSWAGPPKVEL